MKRRSELNVAICLCIIFGFICSLSNVILDTDSENILRITNFFGRSLVFPILFFIFGIIMYNYDGEAKVLFKKGIMFLVFSYVFNIICYFIPYRILDILVIKTDYSLLAYEGLCNTNIFTFLGLTLILFSGIKKINMERSYLFGLGLLCSILNGIFHKLFFFEVKNSLIACFFTGFIYTSSVTSYFSFLGWIVFPLFGYIFMDIFKDLDDKKRAYKIILFVSLVCYLLLNYNSSNLVDYSSNTYFYVMNLYYLAMSLCLTLNFIALCFFIKIKLSKKIVNFCDQFSNNYFAFYIISTIIINYLIMIVARDLIYPGIFELLVITIVLMILIYFIIKLYNFIMDNRLKKN